LRCITEEEPGNGQQQNRIASSCGQVRVNDSSVTVDILRSGGNLGSSDSGCERGTQVQMTFGSRWLRLVTGAARGAAVDLFGGRQAGRFGVLPTRWSRPRRSEGWGASSGAAGGFGPHWCSHQQALRFAAVLGPGLFGVLDAGALTALGCEEGVPTSSHPRTSVCGPPKGGDERSLRWTLSW
jgi:hypothetical protein